MHCDTAKSARGNSRTCPNSERCARVDPTSNQAQKYGQWVRRPVFAEPNTPDSLPASDGMRLSSSPLTSTRRSCRLTSSRQPRAGGQGVELRNAPANIMPAAADGVRVNSAHALRVVQRRERGCGEVRTVE